MVFISFNAFGIKEKKRKRREKKEEDDALTAPEHFVSAPTVPLLGLFCTVLGFIPLPVGGEEWQEHLLHLYVVKQFVWPQNYFFFLGIWVSLFKRQPGPPWPGPAALAAVRQITVWVKL